MLTSQSVRQAGPKTGLLPDLIICLLLPEGSLLVDRLQPPSWACASGEIGMPEIRI